MFKNLLITTALTTMAACSGPLNRIEVAPLSSALEFRAAVSSAVVRSVSLPTYAAAEEISIQGPGGEIIADDDFLWADDPERATTLTLSRHLNEILSATVGPEPYPFAGIPDVSIEVRVDEMLAGNNGVFTLRGQYFVGGDGIVYQNQARSFNFTAPYAGGVNGVAIARAQVTLELAEDIARVLAR